MEEEFYSIEEENKWTSVFQRLHHKARSQAGSQSDGKKPNNVPRNRYRDVLPIDEYRVKLDDEINDYINASYVQVEDVKRKYILCQGPLQHTCHHYWQMIWEQKTTGIIMLNKCIERGVSKCFQYWPDSLSKPILEAGNYRIELVAIDDMLSYRMSTLRLENMESSEEARTVLHFHYTRWPDFGVPQTPDDFLDFLYSVRKTGVLDEGVGPSIVHCSAGIGRSGTFCLVDVCLKKIELTSDLNLELQPILLDMRKQRLGLVQTPDQLRFCYIAILQASIPDEDSDDENHHGGERGEDDEEQVQAASDSDEDEEEIGVINGTGPTNIGVNIYKDHQFDDGPPPIPPRYPDMIPGRTPSPPPPPPPTLPPPGPPEYVKDDTNEDSQSDEETSTKQRDEDTEDILLVQYERNESQEADVKKSSTPWYINGDMDEGSSRDNQPPPLPPPRVESVIRERESPSSADHFLEEGGRGKSEDPLPLPTQPAPVPLVKREGERPRLTSFNEEEALINELNELEKMISPQVNVSEEAIEVANKPMENGPVEIRNQTEESESENEFEKNRIESEENENEPEVDEAALEAKESRKRAREERQRRLNEKVATMKAKIGKEERREWTTSWVVVGMVAIASYCVFYYFS